MKKIFLTSALGIYSYVNEKRIPSKIINTNNMIGLLRSLISSRNRLILIAGNPDDYGKNNEICDLTKKSFEMSELKFEEVILIDRRNDINIDNLIKDADLIILSGGHLPSQNKWFKEMKLENILKSYNGIIIGQSAGSMNCAEVVYSCPELEGEAVNPEFNRWREGLGLTNINVFPHFNEFISVELDGFRMIEDIVLKDSFKNIIYALNDGSFIEIAEDKNIAYGECFQIFNGSITKICENGQTQDINS